MKRYLLSLVFLFPSLLALVCTLSAAAQEPARIPERSVSLTDFDAVPDGLTSNTQAFAKAISALAKQGGGHLNVPEGLYLTGPISLKDCIDLHLERGAVILFSPDKAEFLKDGAVKPALSASKRHDVMISGEGIIDGNGSWWWPVKRSKVSDAEWKEFLKKGGTVTEDGSLWYPFDLKHYPNIAHDARSQEKMRANMVRFTDCTRVTVKDVTLQNSPKFHLVPQRCTDVTIDNVKVRCPWNAQNGDGIDIMNCRNVLVTHCTVDVGDDGICLKAGAGAKALKDGPCKNIVIEYNTVYHAHGGFVIGSEFSGGMEDITVRHNSFIGTDTGLRFKSAPERGGVTRNIRISDIYMANIKDQAVVFETTYADKAAGYEDREAAKTEAFVPEVQDIVMERIVCRGCSTAIKASGTLEMIHDITIRDATFFYYEKGLHVSDSAMVKLESVALATFDGQ